jgi:hypothetical protein
MDYICDISCLFCRVLEIIFLQDVDLVSNCIPSPTTKNFSPSPSYLFAREEKEVLQSIDLDL